MIDFDDLQTRIADEIHGAYRRGLAAGAAAGFVAGALAFGLWIASRWAA